jgi:hypothetical protein
MCLNLSNDFFCYPDLLSGYILPIAQFEELLEDIEDLAIVAERRDEPTTSHTDLIAELKQDGII